MHRPAVQGAEASKTTSVKTPCAGAFRVLICDLQPGAAHRVSFGKQSEAVTAIAQGTCFLKNVVLAEGDVLTIEPNR
jgi:hypothetical protein